MPMGLNLTCPKCGKRMTMNFETSQVFCQHCGHVREDEISRIDETAASVKDKGRQPTVQLTHRGPIQPSAYAAFETGHDLLFEGKTAEALDAFRRAADLQEDFLDAHLWIAQVSDDEKTKRDHLGIVLGYDSMNPEAIRQLMVLNGRLTPEQAARTYHYNDPKVSQVEAVAARTTELLCPSCGGYVTINEAANRVECRFCGFTGLRPANQSVDMDNLLVALLERKAQPCNGTSASGWCSASNAAPSIRSLLRKCPRAAGFAPQPRSC
jgi:ribosomal protein S27AE